MLQHEGNLEMTEQKSHRFTARYDQNQNVLDGALIHALGLLKIIDEYMDFLAPFCA